MPLENTRRRFPAARGVAFPVGIADIIQNESHAMKNAPPDKLILLVDDEPAIRDATLFGLRDRGFRVEAADGAESALKAVARLKPSIIISDLVMPGTNGFELFQEVQKLREYRTIPFVFLTAVDDYYAKKFGKDLGGAAYVTKPVDLDELERILLDKMGT
jgi:DNA-binding response OmpR family regulator